MADTLPSNKVAATVTVHTDETVRALLNLRRILIPRSTYLPLLVKPVLSSPNQYQLSSSELALRKIAPPCACISVPDVSVRFSFG
jgi:hypothetical protein